jgi:predicted NBD/HSP70 family sugar kinase
MSGSPAQLRVRHQRLVFEALQRAGTLSRAELAKRTGLSAPTVGKVAAGLLTQGLIEEPSGGQNGSSRSTPAAGRPSRPLRLARSRPALLAIQLGVRHTRLASLPVSGPDDDRRVSWPVQVATPRSAEAWASLLKRSAGRLGDPHRGAASEDISAVMVSVPGVVDESAGCVLLSPNLHWLEKVDLANLVRGAVTGRAPRRVPVLLMQEIRALALGHLVCQPRDTDFLLVDVGAGVGGAAVVGGRLYEGPLALSGELGHTPVLGSRKGGDRKCGCGGVNCVETLVAREGLLASFATASRARVSPDWRGLQRHVAASGIEPWLDEALTALAAVVAGALNILGVRKVVITGALVELGEAVIQRLAEGVKGAAMWGRFGEVQCEAAPRRRAAGLVARAVDRIFLGGDDR